MVGSCRLATIDDAGSGVVGHRRNADGAAVAGGDPDALRAPRQTLVVSRIDVLVRHHLIGAEQQLAVARSITKHQPDLPHSSTAGTLRPPTATSMQHRLAGRVELAVRRLLEEPAQRPGAGIERRDAVGVEVVAGADQVDIAGRRVAGGDEDEARRRDRRPGSSRWSSSPPPRRCDKPALRLSPPRCRGASGVPSGVAAT